MTVEGSIARYECEDKGQKLFGSETVTCLSSGAWSEEIIECRGEYIVKNFLHFSSELTLFMRTCNFETFAEVFLLEMFLPE